MHTQRPTQQHSTARSDHLAKTTITQIDEDAIVSKHFAGQRRLYDCFLEACLDQFPADAIDLSQALDDDDIKKALRIAHTLKSALLMLGFERESELARSIEVALHQGHPSAARASWETLKGSIQAIANLNEDADGPRSGC